MRFTQSLKKNADFKMVYSQGQSAASRALVLYALRNASGVNRLGISVSKKVGGSVIRSRVRRLIRESYRLGEGMVVCGYDLVFIAKNSARDASFQTIQASVRHLLVKQGVMAP
ncbi:MAG: ribonuclease P protein component [Clostridiales bacterium]|jgi:ribonuclease P protein component|nr:ribonuclease P protein component [Clostridiales bacterium]